MIAKRKIWIGLIAFGLYSASTLLTYVRTGSLYTYDLNFIGLTIRRNVASNTLALQDINAFIVLHILACLAIAWALVSATTYVSHRKKDK